MPIECKKCKGTGQVPDNTYDRCDTAIMHGPGHQSISPCEVVGPHEGHYAQGFDWFDSELINKTVTLPRFPRGGQVQKVYRLASSGFWD